MFGVLDHNSISSTSAHGNQFVQLGHGNLFGVGQFGDNSWAVPENYGSANFLFMENNAFTEIGTTENESGLIDRGGGRVVIRFNHFNSMDNNTQMMSWHGTESNGRYRGTRAFELYQNIYNCTGNCDTTAAGRSGTGLIWGNTITVSGGYNTAFKFNTFRVQGSTGGWGACDGSSVVDSNDGTIYFSGTVASWNGSAKTLTVSGSPGWTTNQWTLAGGAYSLHDVTQNTGVEIFSSGSNTLVLNIGGGPGAFTTPNGGDSIHILRKSACIDQGIGRGAGVLFSGSATPTTSANQVLSPMYVWLNRFNKAPNFDANTGVSSNSLFTTRNREYYAENLNQGIQSNTTSPFNGATTIGMGHGTLVDRPTTCTQGVGYWATDQGSWNQEASGEQGQLYICTATNTWTLNYTPFTYPHPLISGNTSTSGNSPNPPTALQATVQ
jgi:hypothetical protein